MAHPVMNEAPRSKRRGILRNSQKPLPSCAKAMEGSPRLHPRSELRGIRRRRIRKPGRCIAPLECGKVLRPRWEPLRHCLRDETQEMRPDASHQHRQRQVVAPLAPAWPHRRGPTQSSPRALLHRTTAGSQPLDLLAESLNCTHGTLKRLSLTSVERNRR